MPEGKSCSLNLPMCVYDVLPTYMPFVTEVQLIRYSIIVSWLSKCQTLQDPPDNITFNDNFKYTKVPIFVYLLNVLNVSLMLK